MEQNTNSAIVMEVHKMLSAFLQNLWYGSIGHYVEKSQKTPTYI